MSHESTGELLGAFALDAVSPCEAAEIRRHLAECHRCRAELLEHQEVVGLLSGAGGNATKDLWGGIEAETGPGLISGGRSAARATPEGSEDRPRARWRLPGSRLIRRGRSR